MPFIVSDMPLSFTTDDAPEEEIERRRADRIARKQAKAKTRRSRRCITKAMHREEKKPMSDTHTAKKPNETTSEETAAAVYARFILERAEPPACVKGADEEERRFRFIPFETKFTDDAARGPR